MKLEIMKEKIEIPDGISVSIDGNTLIIKGPKGEIKRRLAYPKISIGIENNAIAISAKKATKREKKIIRAFEAHIKNMIKGAKEGHIYRLKICAGHFPMNVSVQGNEFIVSNFLGEKVPRKLKLKEGVKVKVEGQEVIVESINKELAGQTAANIEILTKVQNRDRRIFQDGIYIINKDGKEIK
ncbi:MAG: 50S ribosomal protein L6 [Candidatus Woesearchaeota archaeon]|nr:50S ribosomal protein L6 [Candidatus Woesearchaeota archaeon]